MTQKIEKGQNFHLLKCWMFFSILDHQTLDPDPESGSAIRKNAGSGSGSALNQCGSETLAGRIVMVCFKYGK
jgi:hypothetical protein